MQDNIEVSDKEEFKRQMEQYIYNTGKYMEVKVLVGHGESTPIAEFHGKEVNSEDIARCICSLKDIICTLAEQCPESIELASYMTSTDYNTLFNKGEEDEE